jgi:capsular polysaccharide biosynthesis protein
MSGKTVVASYPTPRVAVETECIFVGGDPNYSHWLFRNLLKLCSLAPAGLVDRLPWLVNDDLRPHQEEYLALLGIPAERLIRVERNQVMRARALVVPALLTNASTIPAGLAWIRGRLSSQMTPPAAATRRVYVSRRDARQRALLNEDELYAALAPLGFEFFVPGEASVAEQIRVFSGAQLIVAVHGAALTNIVFSPPTASVIEITNSAMRDMDDMRRLAASCGQRMETIVCDRYPAHAAPIHVNSDYYVDIAGVLQAVDRALA